MDVHSWHPASGAVAVLTAHFEDMLTGGHPNSLGRTVEVVDLVLADPSRFAELFDTYESADEVVRLRTSNALRRVEAERHDLLVPYIDRLINEIGALEQASAQWTLAVLLDKLLGDMTADQKARALVVMKRNLAEHDDWIVLNNTMETLTKWAADTPGLQSFLVPHLERLQNDGRKSVMARAGKFLSQLTSA